jgi:histone H1/5
MLIVLQACIAASDDKRSGVSRDMIKKVRRTFIINSLTMLTYALTQYVSEEYGVDATGTQLYQLNHAITTGVEDGVFVQPRGPSGKVKFAPRTSLKDKEVRTSFLWILGLR